MMKLLLLFAAPFVQDTKDSPTAQLSTIDSMYVARDTAGLVKALHFWQGEPTPHIRLLQGISGAWTGRATESIEILRPLLDSARSSLTRSEVRDGIRALAESYSRKRQYSDAAALYDAELQTLDTAVDSARARATVATIPDITSTAPILDALTSTKESPPPSPEKIPGQLSLIGVLFALFLIPKMLQRFRIPGAITSLLMGVGASALGLFPHDATLTLFATLGIVSLFLFAGLEIDSDELRNNVK